MNTNDTQSEATFCPVCGGLEGTTGCDCGPYAKWERESEAETAGCLWVVVSTLAFVAAVAFLAVFEPALLRRLLWH